MHPILRNKGSVAAYIALWAVLGSLLAALLRLPGDLAWREALLIAAPLCAFYAVLCLAPLYVCRALPLGTTTITSLLVQHLGAAVLACALWIGIVRLAGFILALDTELDPVIPQLVAIGLLLYLLSVALHYVLLAVEASRESAIQARDAELRALKAQINPHFLFNCLNSISALTTSDPVRARDMCIRLSDFLRKTLGLGERESIPWREELELARTYLEVEQVRYGARLRVEIQADEACAECQVPPLVLQPLIENAVRHGIATLVEGGDIRVRAGVRDGLLEVSVENGFDPDSPSPRRHGLGLRNIRSRLATRFGSAARLVAAVQDRQFRAEMVLPCHKPQ
jgi:hypothetical protein